MGEAIPTSNSLTPRPTRLDRPSDPNGSSAFCQVIEASRVHPSVIDSIGDDGE